MRRAQTTLSTVYRGQRTLLAGLAARVIDVTPGSGEIEFSFSYELWDHYKHDLLGGYRLSEDAWTMLEIALWEKAQRYPTAWMMLLQSEEVAFVDNCRYADQQHPRVVTAVLVASILKRMGYKIELGYEYSTPYEELKRKPRRL